MVSVDEDGAVQFEGKHVGRIEGLHFIANHAETANAEDSTLSALIAAEISARAQVASLSTDHELQINRWGELLWNRAIIGRLEAGSALLKPRSVVYADDVLGAAEKEVLSARLEKFTERYIAQILEPLLKLEEAEGLEGAVRDIAARLSEKLGFLPREQVSENIKSLSQEDRAKLRQFGVRFGAFYIFLPLLLKPAATDLRLALWALFNKHDLKNLPVLPNYGLTSAAYDINVPDGFYNICGFHICESRIARIDMIERLANMVRDSVFWRPRFPEEKRPRASVEGGGFIIVPDMMSLVGCSGDVFCGILRSLGFRMQPQKIARPIDQTKVSADEAVLSDQAETQDQEQLEPVCDAVPLSEPVSLDQIPSVPDHIINAANIVAPSPQSEEVEIEVWWPENTGPFRKRSFDPERSGGKVKFTKSRKFEGKFDSKAEGRADNDGSAAKARHKDKKGTDNKEKHHKRKMPHHQRPVDPDSPFAVLSALRDQMVKGD